MKRIATLLFEARMLKEIPRSGFQFLGAGKESVAEHVYMMSFIAMALAKLTPGADLGKVLSLCLLHDLPEARIGDLNTVQKAYVTADEDAAIADMSEGLPFGEEMTALMAEYNGGESLEAGIAKDADQLAFILELKMLSDVGHPPAGKWMDHVGQRIQTDQGKALLREILATPWDGWWLEKFQK